MLLKESLRRNKCLVLCARMARIILKNLNHPLLFLNYLFEARRFYFQRRRNDIWYFVTNLSPYLTDRTGDLGVEPHYTYHTAWAARKLAEFKPEYHIDISSHRFFATLVSAFVPIDFYEYRTAEIGLENLNCKAADVLNLPFETNSVKSISCMHVVEHIGLGRYGDPLDVNGDFKAFTELARVLHKNGKMLFVVPIAEKNRLQFNEQRVYSYDYLMKWFNDSNLNVKEFSLVPDGGKIKGRPGMILNATKGDLHGQRYACACFVLEKRTATAGE